MTYQEFINDIDCKAGVREYIQSEEDYKGFKLVIVMERFMSSPSLEYHRRCHIFDEAGERIGIGKTKKELKDLIDHDCFK